MNHPLAIPLREKVSYFIRFLFCLLTMESVLHTMYVVAIKDSMAWEGDGPADLSMIGFWNLVVVWLKVSQPYRLIAGICVDYRCGVVVDTMAILSIMGIAGRIGSTGKHGPLCCQQLLDTRILEILASLVQSVVVTVSPGSTLKSKVPRSMGETDDGFGVV